MSRPGGYGGHGGPPGGTRRLQVITNSFKITGLPRKHYYQYEAFEDEKLRRGKEARRRIEVIERLQNHTRPDIFKPKIIYDSDAIAYSSTVLSFGSSCTFDVNMVDRAPRPSGDGQSQARGIMRVSFKRVDAAPISFEDLQRLIDGQTSGTGQLTPRATVALNLIQLILRQGPNLMFPNNEKAFFCREAGSRTFGGLEVLKGFYQSVRPTLRCLLVNIDTTCGVVYQEGPMVDVALGLMGQRDIRKLCVNDPAQLAKFKKFFKGILVTFVHRKGKKKIEGIVPKAGFQEFEWIKDKADGVSQTITIQAYFREMYNLTIRYPEAIGVLIGGGSVVPIELCVVAPNQRYKQRFPPELTKLMVELTSEKPRARLESITRGIGRGAGAPLDYSSSPFVRDAEITVSSTPTVIDGKVLAAPSLQYKDGVVNPDSGSWNVLNQQFNEPKSILCCAVVDYASNPRDRQRNEHAMKMILQSCEKLGMRTSPPRAYISSNGGNAIEPLVQLSRESAQNKATLDLVLVILPFSAAEIRTTVKRWGDVQEGIVTQCVRIDKLSKAKDQYYNNVALKINAKLGGINSIPRSNVLKKLSERPYMIMGADVGHPAPGVHDQPSVAALVASYDPHAMKYHAYSTIQHPRLEPIEQLQTMVSNALDQLGAPAARLVFFRDGLSEGEYATVAEKEIKDIKAAVDDVWRVRNVNSPKPTLTYIIVGKRHHVRFFPQSERDGDRRSGNCPAGFVADQGIGNPIAKDYYLLSHGGLLGTSRPSHYIIILDENFSSNIEVLQELSFSLCHAYARATRSVSIPAPVYYADLVCGRANFHFSPDLKYDDSSASVISGDKSAFDLERWSQGFRGPHPNMLKKMFYM